MKLKLLTLFAVPVFAFSMIGCGQQTETEEAAEETAEAAEETAEAAEEAAEN